MRVRQFEHRDPDKNLARRTHGNIWPAMLDLALAQTMAFVAAPQAVIAAWCNLGRPTVRVERGYGTGVFQDLYPDLFGNLRTKPLGGGKAAAAWAGGVKLLVERIYNQAGADPNVDFITALSADKRVLLDVATPGAPFFAGVATGTQDSNQHATQRGYGLPSSVFLKTNDHPLSLIAAHQHAGGSSIEYLVQDTAATPTRFWELDASNSRHFAQWAIAVRTYGQVATNPHVLTQWSLDDARGIGTEYSTRAGEGGVFQNNGVFNSSSSSFGLNLFGPTNSLQGKCFAFIAAQGAVSPASMTFSGIPSKLARTFAKTITGAPTLSYPYANAVIPMNLATQVADIPIKLIGKPSQAYQASWNGGSTVQIGTADGYGVLDTVLPAQPKGNGTLTVAESGGANSVTVATVAVGIVLVALGESNPDGRGAMYPVSIPTGSLRKDRINWTTLQAYGTSADNPVVPITNPGSGYSVNDVLTLVGGTGTAAQVKVTSVNGSGGITGLASVANGTGTYSVAPSTPTSVTGGTGTGATVSPVYSQGNQYWLSFVQKLYDLFGAVIAIGQTTVGGSYFYRPNSPGPWEGMWSTTTNVNVPPAEAAASRSELLSLQAEFLTPSFVLLDLGLNDMALSTSQSQFYTRALNLASWYRTGLSNSNILIWSILSGGEDGTVANALITPVRAAQLQAWNTGGTGYIPFGSFAHVHADLSDNVHFSSQATKDVLGSILFRYARHLWLGGAQARAPQFASASVSGNQVTVTFTGGVSPLTHSGSDVNGWKLTDGNGARTISAVSVSGSTVTLTADQAITTGANTRTLNWCMDKAGIGTTLADSDATTPLPPEPFSATF